MGLANYFKAYSPAQLENHYWCLVRFWTSVCWHHPHDSNKQALSQNIMYLSKTYRRMNKE